MTDKAKLAVQAVHNVVGIDFSDETFVTYRHFRCVDYAVDAGEYYSPKGGATFMIVADPVTKKLAISVAECSHKDLFNKRLGRTVATGRFFTGDFHVMDWDREIPLHENIVNQHARFNPYMVKDILFDLVISG